MLTVEKNYNELAAKTESHSFEGKIYSKQLYQEGLNLAIQTAQLLDIFKKHFFYNRNYSQEQFLNAIQSVEKTLALLKEQNIEEVLKGNLKNNDEIKFSKEDQNGIRLYHMILGVMTEGGEIGEALKDHQQGKELDWVNIAEENGDIDWYQAIPYNIVKEQGGDLTELDVRTKNINKLAARYGDKFSDYNANNRDLIKEREILEK